MEALGYLLDAFTLATALSLGLATPLLAFVVFRRPAAGLWLYACAVLQVALFPKAPALSLGVSLYFADLVGIALFIAALARFATHSATARFPLVLLPVSAMLILSLSVGALQYKTLAAVAFRPYFYGLAIAVYFGSFDFRRELLRPALKGWGLLGLAMILIATLRWLDLLPADAGAEAAAMGRFAALDRMRSIDSGGTLLLSQAGFVLLMGASVSAPRSRLRTLTPLIFAFVLVLQHRSVWAAALAAFLVRYLLDHQPSANPWRGLAGIASVLAVGAWLSFSDIGSDTAAQLAASVERAVRGEDSASARLQSWAFVLQRWAGGGPWVWIQGFPFGTSMERTLVTSTGGSRLISFQAHNFFVQTLFNTGLLGMLCALTLLGWMARKLHDRMKASSDPEPYRLLLVLLAGQMVFFLFYGIGLVSAWLFGLMLSASHDKSAHESARDASPRAGAGLPEAGWSAAQGR